MDIAVKQRLLGGVVLVAGAILFLPMLLEGAGVKALQPPSIPTPPSAPTTAQLTPALQKQASRLEQGISSSHGEPTFYPVQAPQVAEKVPTSAVQESFHLVTPPAATDKPVLDNVAVQKAAALKLALEQSAKADAQANIEAQAKSDSQAKASKAAAKAIEKSDEKKVVDAKKLALQKQAAQKQIEQKPVPTAAATVVDTDPATNKASADPLLPKAWVVQVAVLNAKESALALQHKLQAKGLRAVISGKEGAWHVTIAPELDKAVAEATKARIDNDAELKTKAWVQAYRP